IMICSGGQNGNNYLIPFWLMMKPRKFSIDLQRYRTSICQQGWMDLIWFQILRGFDLQEDL
ncbi:MAG: hypothetical protein ACK5N9_02895, partial [Pirellula sp.]